MGTRIILSTSEYPSLDVSNYLLHYGRSISMCTGTGTAIIETTPIVLDTPIKVWDALLVYENDVLMGRFYIFNISKSESKGSWTFNCQDASKILADTFLFEPNNVTQASEKRALHWIEKYLNEAGISYEVLAEGQGAYLSYMSEMGMKTALEQIQELIQQSGWYFYFSGNGTCIIKDMEIVEDGFEYTITDSSILEFKHIKDDKPLRNRAVVYGAGDEDSKEWVHAEARTITPYDIDANDIRTIVFANSNVYNADRAQDLANTLLAEFARISDEKTFTLIDYWNVWPGENVQVLSSVWAGIGRVTTIEVSGDAHGRITTLTLDQRCPRMFVYTGRWPKEGGSSPGWVYIGTESSGVWRKEIYGSIWEDYSQGLSNLKVTDLYICNGVQACVCGDGFGYVRFVNEYQWKKINTTEFPDYGMEVYHVPEVMAKSCTIDKETNQVTFGFDHTTKNKSWVVRVSPDRKIESMDLVQAGSYNGFGMIDLDKSTKETMITTIGPLAAKIETSSGVRDTMVFSNPNSDSTIFCPNGASISGAGAAFPAGTLEYSSGSAVINMSLIMDAQYNVFDITTGLKVDNRFYSIWPGRFSCYNFDEDPILRHRTMSLDTDGNEIQYGNYNFLAHVEPTSTSSIPNTFKLITLSNSLRDGEEGWWLRDYTIYLPSPIMQADPEVTLNAKQFMFPSTYTSLPPVGKNGSFIMPYYYYEDQEIGGVASYSTLQLKAYYYNSLNSSTQYYDLNSMGGGATISVGGVVRQIKVIYWKMVPTISGPVLCMLRQGSDTLTGNYGATVQNRHPSGLFLDIFPFTFDNGYTKDYEISANTVLPEIGEGFPDKTPGNLCNTSSTEPDNASLYMINWETHPTFGFKYTLLIDSEMLDQGDCFFSTSTYGNNYVWPLCESSSDENANIIVCVGMASSEKWVTHTPDGGQTIPVGENHQEWQRLVSISVPDLTVNKDYYLIHRDNTNPGDECIGEYNQGSAVYTNPRFVWYRNGLFPDFPLFMLKPLVVKGYPNRHVEKKMPIAYGEGGEYNRIWESTEPVWAVFDSTTLEKVGDIPRSILGDRPYEFHTNVDEIDYNIYVSDYGKCIYGIDSATAQLSKTLVGLNRGIYDSHAVFMDGYLIGVSVENQERFSYIGKFDTKAYEKIGVMMLMSYQGHSYKIVYSDNYPAKVEISQEYPTVVFDHPTENLRDLDHDDLIFNDPMQDRSIKSFTNSYKVKFRHTARTLDTRVFEVKKTEDFYAYHPVATADKYIAIGGIWDKSDRTLYYTQAEFKGKLATVRQFSEPRMQAIETNNNTDVPYFFLAGNDGAMFLQRDPPNSGWFNYSSTLPGSQIHVIRVDDKL